MTEILSTSAISKQVSRCCINFPHELTCRIFTNQSIKIGRRAWTTRDHGESKLTASATCKNWLNFRVRGRIEIKILLVQLISTTYFLCILKIELEAAIIWKLVTCQRITSKNNELDGSIPEPKIRSCGTGQRIPCFDSCQLIAWMSNIRLHLDSQTTIYS